MERAISSHSLDTGKSKLEHRHSAGSAIEADASLTALRAEHARQEEVVAELADVSKEEALQKIHSLHEDLKVTSLRQAEGEAGESVADEEDVQVTVEVTELPPTGDGSPSKAATTTASAPVQGQA